MKNSINIAEDFSRYPAGRFKNDGPYSGEAFRAKFLEPALESGSSLVIDLDGARGYGSSFLEEAFGGLVRLGYSTEDIKSRIALISTKQSLIPEIYSYIDSADVTDR